MKEILLIEDSDSDAELAQRTLKLAGLANPVHRLCNGTEAMAYLQHVEESAAIADVLPSILLVDVKLPGMSGFEILERIRNRPAFAKMLRIVLSHLDDTKSIKRAYALGADSFLTKPIQQAELRALIENFPGYWVFQRKAGNSPSGIVTLCCQLESAFEICRHGE